MKLFLTLAAALCLSVYSYSQSWHYLDINITGNGYGALYPVDENLVYVITDNGHFFKTTDGGLNWTEYNTGVSEYFFDLVFYNGNTGFAVGTNGTLIKTTDGGENWMIISTGTTNHLFSISISSLNNIWAVGENGTVLHSVNSGNDWALINLTDERLNSVEFKNETTGFFAGNNGTLFYTTNGGITWETVDIGTADDLFSLTITENYTRLLAGNIEPFLSDIIDYDGYTVFKTSNASDWESYSVDSEMSIGFSSLYFQNDDLGFMLSADVCLCDECHLKVVRTTNSGDDWEASLSIITDAGYNCIFSYVYYSDIKFATDEIGYVLQGNKLLKTMDGGVFTILEVDEFNNEHTISIYPNPVNDVFTIDVHNIGADELSFEIFDAAGKKVFSENGLSHKTTVDISGFNNGMYFIKFIKNGKMTDSRKLIKK